MKIPTLVLAFCLIPVVASAQSSSFDPLTELGLSFGASREQVLAACERAGLVVVSDERISPGQDVVVSARGAWLHGLPTVVKFSIGCDHGLRTLFIGVTADAAHDAVVPLRDELLGSITGRLGTPVLDTAGRRAPAHLRAWPDEYRWSADDVELPAGAFGAGSPRVVLACNIGASEKGFLLLGVTITDLSRQ